MLKKIVIRLWRIINICLKLEGMFGISTRETKLESSFVKHELSLVDQSGIGLMYWPTVVWNVVKDDQDASSMITTAQEAFGCDVAHHLAVRVEYDEGKLWATFYHKISRDHACLFHAKRENKEAVFLAAERSQRNKKTF